MLIKMIRSNWMRIVSRSPYSVYKAAGRAAIGIGSAAAKGVTCLVRDFAAFLVCPVFLPSRRNNDREKFRGGNESQAKSATAQQRKAAWLPETDVECHELP